MQKLRFGGAGVGWSSLFSTPMGLQGLLIASLVVEVCLDGGRKCLCPCMHSRACKICHRYLQTCVSPEPGIVWH
eukprot:1440731-Amphidinium_carterae.1